MAGLRHRSVLKVIATLSVAIFFSLPAPGALAFDFFGLFGSDTPPPVNQKSLPYKLAIGGPGLAKGIRQALQDTSLLYKLRKEAPRDGNELAQRAEADLPKLIDTMWGYSHYAAKVRVDIAGVPINYGQQVPASAAPAAERSRGRQHVPVRVVVEPGPSYRFARVDIVDAASQRPFPQGVLPTDIKRNIDGTAARTEYLVNLALRISRHFQEQRHPYVKIADPAPVIDHRTRMVSIQLAVTPGPRAPIGDIRLSGTKDVDPKVVRSFIYVEPGVMFSPKRMTEIRKSVTQIEAIGSARVRPAEKLAPDGSVPVEVIVSERLPRALGASVSYSTVDGPSLKGYWMHRNLFGGAERLRFDADLFYLTTGTARLTGTKAKLKDNIGGRFGVSFVKPALGGTRIDFVTDAFVLRERTKAYEAQLGNIQAALRYRFADRGFVQVGVEGEAGRVTDVVGSLSYQLVGLPITAQWDTTDHPLDPTTGFRVKANVTPYAGFGGAAPFLVAANLVTSAYYSLDEKSRYILAGRIAFATISGGDLSQIPANRRLFAGGGGSVRGYAYRSLGPTNAAGQLIGGRSLFEASLEARIKITDTIGIVPFIDIGNSFASQVPDFKDLRVGAGLGLRYYTAIGPIRFDVAVPVGKRKGEAPFALYISLGQAF